MNTKNCIVHLPYKINPLRASGPNVRPSKMKKAFEENGYNVYFIEGDVKERREIIEEITNLINNHVSFDFVYSESSTMPTLLTEYDHIPRGLNLDFNFLKFCRSKKISVCLFYRDIYWKYPEYKLQVTFVKRIILKMFFRYDLYKYNQVTDILYVPTLGYIEKIRDNLKMLVNELPPGYDKVDTYNNEPKSLCMDNKLNLFYVGGINPMYDLTELFMVASRNSNIRLKVVTRKTDWKQYGYLYNKYLSPNISISHEQGDSIQKYYDQADVLVLTIKPNEYRKMALPIKLFEYIGQRKPIIAYNNSYTGEFIKSSGIGFVVEYGTDELEHTLSDISNNKSQLADFAPALEIAANSNTWSDRALKVIEDVHIYKKNHNDLYD